MAATGDTKRPTISMNVYAKYKDELGSIMCEVQSGSKNSQYGKHWYTNLRTGESYTFKSKPDEFWVEGRNWFKNKRNTVCKINFKKEKLSYSDYLNNKKQNTKNKYFNLLTKILDGYHNSNETCLKNYIINVEKLNYNLLSNKFKRHFPIYKRLLNENKSVRLHIKPNKNLVGIYY